MRLIDADALMEAFEANDYYEVYIQRIIDEAPTVQREGWVSVPIEPTREMLESAKLAQKDYGSYEEWVYFGCDEDVTANYKAMIQAAPKE